MRRLLLILLSICCGLTVLARQHQDIVWRSGQTIRLYLERSDAPVSETAAAMLKGDFQDVLQSQLERVNRKSKGDIVALLEKSLPREGFTLSVNGNQLIVRGADAHGLAYGLLEVSRLLGVSPWTYWADCSPRRQQEVRIAAGYHTAQHPAVAYRGIFINDEDFGLLPWASRQEPEAWTQHTGRIKGAIGPKVNERIFQLLLRLRANYYWPAMHEVTQPFFRTKGNREMAARYGIYIGTSHCEPMGCNAVNEWEVEGSGAYNYVTNASAVRHFWQQRLDETKGQEMVYTLGMRGIHDGPMQGVKALNEQCFYLQKVIDDQRRMIDSTLCLRSSTLARSSTYRLQISQVFVPYKEVLDVYHAGLRVPDDVTLMWCDDNYGYIRHFPDSLEQKRSGGNAIYYHLSYWGRPHDYLWLSTTPTWLIHQQLSEAYRRGIRQMWVINVGDLKPAEPQLDYILQMAWHSSNNAANKETLAKPNEESLAKPNEESLAKTNEESLAEPNEMTFWKEVFGDSLGMKIQSLMEESYRLAFRRRPEFMAGTRTEEADKKTWSTPHPLDGFTAHELMQRLEDYHHLATKVAALKHSVPADRRDAYFELVEYPVFAAEQMNVMWLSKYEQATLNDSISESRSLSAHDSIQHLTYYYNKVLEGGKWDGMMNAAPRNLTVFAAPQSNRLSSALENRPPSPLEGEITQMSCALNSIEETTKPLFQTDYGLLVPKDSTMTLPFESAEDSITLILRLLPNHPVEGARLAFQLSVDDNSLSPVEYQTQGRSEEWKRNVLRNYAERTVRVALTKNTFRHSLTLKALTEGVYLQRVLGY